jgi:hypothetical protein
MPTVTLPSPETGREFLRALLILGVSQRSVAKVLGIKPDTLARHESSALPVDPMRATHWRQALAYCGSMRLVEAMRYGLTQHDLDGTELAATVAALSSK